MARFGPRLIARLVARLVARFHAPRFVPRLAPRLRARFDSARLGLTHAGLDLRLLIPRLALLRLLVARLLLQVPPARRHHRTVLRRWTILGVVVLPIASTIDAAAIKSTRRRATIVSRVASASADRAHAVAAITHIGRRSDAKSVEIPPGHTAARIVIHRTLAFACDKSVAVGLRRAPVLEDEARLRTVGAHEHHATAAIGPVRIVPGIVVHIHAEANARVVIRIPIRIADVAVAVVAQEPRIVVMTLDVVRHDVVIPVGVAFRNDPLCEIGERDVRISAHATVRDYAVIPMIARLDLVIHEGIGRGHRKQIAHAGLVVDRKGFAVELIAVYFEIATAAGEVVLPRLARKQDANAPVSIDAENRDVGVLIETEVQLDSVAAGI